jgi:tetratricopeptide (TPR) repeat protein
MVDMPFEFLRRLRKPLSEKELQSKIEKHGLLVKTKNRPSDAINLSVFLILDMQADSAITLLKSHLNTSSKNYSLLSNLGVAYELSGDLDSAYYYTSKAVEINSNSHSGSEWIHLKILEAQMEITKDPNWLKNNTVLGLKISQDSLPLKAKPRDRGKLHLTRQIEYQLIERMYFVKPKNKIIGQLLLQLADLYSTNVTIVDAITIYLMAKDYDPNLTTLINKRLAKIKAIMNPTEKEKIILDSLEQEFVTDTIIEDIVEEKEEPKVVLEEKSNNNFIWYIFGGTLLIILLVVRFRLSKNQQKKK